MFANIGWGEMLLLLVVGLVVLGPERLPGAIRWTSNSLRQARDYVSGATTSLREDLGPEFEDLRQPIAELNKLRGMTPRAAITKHLLEGDDSIFSSFESGVDDVRSAVADTKAEVIAPSAAAQQPSGLPAEPDPDRPTPFDPDAT